MDQIETDQFVLEVADEEDGRVLAIGRNIERLQLIGRMFARHRYYIRELTPAERIRYRNVAERMDDQEGGSIRSPLTDY